MQDAELEPTLPPGLPDDWRLDRDLPCPNCRYNLRTLHTPRCPECGTVFHWEEVLRVECPRCGKRLTHEDRSDCAACGLVLNRTVMPAGIELVTTRMGPAPQSSPPTVTPTACGWQSGKTTNDRESERRG